MDFIFSSGPAAPILVGFISLLTLVNGLYFAALRGKK